MRQGTLKQFLNLSYDRLVPEYFSVLWKDGHPSFRFEKPFKEEDTILVKNCNLRFRGTNYEVVMYTSAGLVNFDGQSDMPSSTSIPMLKSLLQKAIRRGMTRDAIYAARELLTLDPMVFYRRLPIIMIEDVCLHDGFCILVWHMMAGVKPSDVFVRWALGLVHLLCAENQCIDYVLNEKVRLCENIPRDMEQKELVWCVIFRISFGGMAGDIQMMTWIVNQMIIQRECTVSHVLVEPYNSENVIPFPKPFLYECIDFHVHPRILDIDSHISREELKKMMWHNSSSVNHRRRGQLYDADTWMSVCNQIRSNQMRYLQSLQQG